MSSAQVGEQRMSYTMQPLNVRGQWIAGGNHYADANSIESAREYAGRVLAAGNIIGYTVYGVEIVGQIYEFGGDAWRPVTDSAARYVREVVARTEPAPLTPDDMRKECYFTTVLDYPEHVHERRSDGSCKCGHHASAWPATH